jgi:hypothetical protein
LLIERLVLIPNLLNFWDEGYKRGIQNFLRWQMQIAVQIPIVAVGRGLSGSPLAPLNSAHFSSGQVSSAPDDQNALAVKFERGDFRTGSTPGTSDD